MQVLLVRHGETDANRERRTQGIADNELNAAGLEQARRLGLAFSPRGVEAVYSSPLLRARRTADAIAVPLSLPVIVEDHLRELHHGELDGLTADEMGSRYPAIVASWATDAATVRLPGGESMQDCQERVWAVLERLRDRHPDGSVVVVSHNLAILGVVCRALGLNLSHFRRLRLETAAVTEIGYNGDRITLHRFNDTCHLL